MSSLQTGEEHPAAAVDASEPETETDVEVDMEMEIKMEMGTETDTFTDSEAEAAESFKSNGAYPLAEATYDQVVQSAQLFSDKLKSFHSSFFSSDIMLPSLGENELDLHRLFVEVTSRGGIEKVIREHRWKEVNSLFNLPSISNSSFHLRKYYVSLLYHFEQSYYFGRRSPRIPVTVPANEESTSDGQLQENLKLQPGITIIGTIDGKCDNGYVVSVNIGGSQQMKGILYHLPDMSALMPSRNPADTSITITQHHKRRRKSRLTSRDPAKPKPNRSGYTFFFEEQYSKLKPSYQGRERGISKRIGHLWNRLSEAEKQVYQEKGSRDKERYEKEMREYNLSRNL